LFSRRPVSTHSCLSATNLGFQITVIGKVNKTINLNWPVKYELKEKISVLRLHTFFKTVFIMEVAMYCHEPRASRTPNP
jgi:hypothetical protein